MTTITDTTTMTADQKRAARRMMAIKKLRNACETGKDNTFSFARETQDKNLKINLFLSGLKFVDASYRQLATFDNIIINIPKESELKLCKAHYCAMPADNDSALLIDPVIVLIPEHYRYKKNCRGVYQNFYIPQEFKELIGTTVIAQVEIQTKKDRDGEKIVLNFSVKKISEDEKKYKKIIIGDRKQQPSLYLMQYQIPGSEKFVTITGKK